MVRCGKIKWLDKNSAKEAIRRHRRDGRLHAYKCPACTFWHTGHVTSLDILIWERARYEHIHRKWVDKLEKVLEEIFL